MSPEEQKLGSFTDRHILFNPPKNDVSESEKERVFKIIVTGILTYFKVSEILIKYNDYECLVSGSILGKFMK